MRAPASRPGRLAALAAVAAALTLGACGDDETTTTEISGEAWTADAEEICEAASEEAIALPLPGSAKEIAADAAARAEIVAMARDELSALEVPEDVDEELVGDYLAQLNADVELLELGAGSKQLEAATDLEAPGPLIDESAGQIASELGLDECAAFANAVARTP